MAGDAQTSGEGYTDATVVAAEGARVAFLTCETCGATVMADPRDGTDWPEQHQRWHHRLREALGGATRGYMDGTDGL